LKSVRVFAPGSVANFGVGFDALGAALDGPGDVVTARLVRRPGVRVVSITGDGGRLPRDARRNTAAVAAAAVLEEHGRGRVGIEIELAKGLPLASGLGSSAASAAAGALAAGLLLGVRQKRMLLSAVLFAEHAADGAWHGDNAFSALLGGMLLVLSSDPEHLVPPVPLRHPASLRLVLVHPELQVLTRRARAVLPKKVSLAAHVAHAAAFAGLVAALAAGDLAEAGRLVSSDRIVETARAPLVPGHAAVTAAMRGAGAFGCALAGAGPAILALSRKGPLPSRIARAAVRAFAREGIAASARVHRVDPRGARPV
jgi:homoserine kinase